MAFGVGRAVPSLADPPKAEPYRVVPVEHGGTVEGTCRIAEAVPPWTLHVGRAGMDCCVDHETERMVHGEGCALGNCLVTLAAIAAGKDWPESMRPDGRTARIEIEAGMYKPHVAWVRTATQLAFENHDACGGHNPHAYRAQDGATQFNFSVPPHGTLSDAAGAFLGAPGEYRLMDDSHSWMSAYVHVLEHPYADLTSAQAAPASGRKAGAYALSAVPPGDYVLVCWHEGMEETPVVEKGRLMRYSYSDDLRLTKPVKVEAGKTSVVDFEFPAPKPPEPSVTPKPPPK